MKPFVLVCFIAMATVSFAQRKSAFSVAEIEKKGGVSGVLGNNIAFTSASANFTTSYARCRWNINPSEYAISGSVAYHIEITKDANDIVFDLDDALTVDSVLMHNNRIFFVQKQDKTLTLSFSQTTTAGTEDSLLIYYHGTPASNGFGSFTKRFHNGDVPVIWTLSEPYGARDWWPCRNGVDDKIDSLDIYVTHPSVYAASANGLPADTTSVNGFTTTHFKHRYPIATYLVGVAVTNYITFTKQLTLQTGILPVTTTVYPEFSDYFQTYISPVYDALQLYDRYFGAYPFMNERYGQTQWDWGGGMEHQTNSFVLNADEYLMAHELAHQWFGDKITLGSWQDIWLNEGFATYLADIFYTEHYHPENLSAIVSQDMNMATAEPDGSVWVDDTTDVNRIFSNHLSYKKGAMLLRMLRWTMGDSLFFKGVNLYQQDSLLRYRFARTSDLQRNLETAAGTSLDTFFKQWFYGKGFPSFGVTWNWKNGWLQLQIAQTTSNASVSYFNTPLQLVFKNTSEQQSFIIPVNQKNLSVTLPLSFNPNSVLIDPSQFIISKNNTSVKDSALYISIPLPNDADLIVYPNPAQSILRIQFNAGYTMYSVNIKIASASGAIVYKKSFTNLAQNMVTLPVNQLSPGVYFIVAENEKGVVIKKKFIKR